MKNLDKNLSQIFDIEPISMEESSPKTDTEMVVVEETSEVETDYQHARKNIKALTVKGNDALDKLMLVADESEHPRAYEVVATLMKTMADLNKDLLDIQKKKRDLVGKEVVPSDGSINVDKAVFVGSTSDLIKLIKNNRE
jgi:hypothetical protein